MLITDNRNLEKLIKEFFKNLINLYLYILYWNLRILN